MIRTHMNIRRLVLLTPGAGSTRNHSSLLAIDAALTHAASEAGFEMLVERMDFPHKLARAPICVAAIRETVGGLMDTHGFTPDEVVLGGRSMGGRMCSMAIAEGFAVGGLFCVSYPLHPPDKPENLRVAHFPLVNVDTLFISGTRDAFGSPAEFAQHTPELPKPFEHQWIEGGDHGLAKHESVVAASVAAWIVNRATNPPG
jgi:uncharacterized protein